MAVATGIGSLPGDDIAEAVRTVAGELPDLPHLPELPARGVVAGLTGRTLAVVAELGFDLQPAGWRLTGSSGVDHRRARSLLSQDLDRLEEHFGGYAGRLKVQLAGPWTLAATVERPRGDRVLADVGARRELAEALALGVVDHLADVRRRVPGASLVLQLDEPALPAVLAGAVPTASGFHRHRSVDPPAAAEPLRWALTAAAEAEAAPVVHCCAGTVPVALLRDAGARALSVDPGTLAPAAYDELGAALDAGDELWLGVVASTEPATAESIRAVVARVERFLAMVGYDVAEVADRLVLTPTCGLVGASPAYARTALELVRSAARELG